MTAAILLLNRILNRLRYSRAIRRILHPVIEMRRKTLLYNSPLADARYYAAQLGQADLSKKAAVDHFLHHGPASGCSLIPLFDPQWYAEQIGCSPEEATIAFLRGHPAAVSISPFFDTATCIKTLGLPLDTKPVDALREFMRATDEQSLVPSTGFVLGETTVRDAHDKHIRATRSTAREPSIPLATLCPDPNLSMSSTQSVRVILSLSQWGQEADYSVQSVVNQSHENVKLTILCSDDSDEIPPKALTTEVHNIRVEYVRVTEGAILEEQNRLLRHTPEDFVLFLEPQWKLTRDFLSSAISVALANNLDFVAGPAQIIAINDANTQTINPAAYDELLKRSSGLVLSSYLFRLSSLRESLIVPNVQGINASYLRLLEALQSNRGGAISVPAVTSQNEAAGAAVSSVKGDMLALSEHRISWDLLQHQVDNRDPELVSILMPVYEDYRFTCSAVSAVLDHADGHSIEIIIVNNSESPHIQRFLEECLLADPRVRIVDEARNTNFALGTNLAFAHSHGSRIVCLNNDTLVQTGWLTPLLLELEKDNVRIAQSLLLYPDRRIQTAGTVCFGARVQPQHFLVDHDESEGQVVRDLAFNVVSAASVALFASTFSQARGFDASYVNGFEDVDLCLRLSQGEARARVVPDSVVIHFESRSKGRSTFADENRKVFFEKWRCALPNDSYAIYSSAGIKVLGFQPGPFFPKAVQRDSRAILASAARENPGAEKLRWSVKIASPSGPAGDYWGDTIFAERLAESLRALGQFVSVDRREHHVGPADMTEDVVISLRGLDLVAPNPLAINVLWVISHPDLVKATELRAYDLRFAASATWSRKMSTPRFPVVPLLQATAHKYDDELGPSASFGPVVFVGSTRGVERSSVIAAISADVALEIYGPGWTGVVEDRYVRGQYVSPEQLPRLYQRSSFVLNDHWSDMRTEGFISNRVFDAVASGARVISDPVEGLDQIFGPSVQTWSSPEDIAALVEAPERFGSAEDLRETALRVGREHSFDSRARTLLDAVMELRRSSQRA